MGAAHFDDLFRAFFCFFTAVVFHADNFKINIMFVFVHIEHADADLITNAEYISCPFADHGILPLIVMVIVICHIADMDKPFNRVRQFDKHAEIRN